VFPSFALNSNRGGKTSNPPVSNLQDTVSIGKIVKAHGLKGALKVVPYGETLTTLEPGFSVVAAGGDGRTQVYTVKAAQRDKRYLLLFLSGIENRDQAEALKGAVLCMEKARLPKLEAGTYYWADIIGCEVFTIEDEYIGSVQTIIPTAGNDVYVVTNGEDEILIPALEWVVLSVDTDDRTIRVDLPEGL